MSKLSFIEGRDPSVDRTCRPRPEKQRKLFDSITECDDEGEENLEPISTINSNDAPDAEDGCPVYLRLRPVATNESCNFYKTSENVLVASNANTRNPMENHYVFTDIFDGSVTQAQIYDNCIRRSIHSNENLTVLAYGTSGSGKTFTLLGSIDQPGVVQRAIEHIFAVYKNNIYTCPSVKIIKGQISILNDNEIMFEEEMRQKILNYDHLTNCKNKEQILNEHFFENRSLQNTSVFVWVSFAELYNEQVYDLLSPVFDSDLAKRRRLKIITNDGIVCIKDLMSIYVKDSHEAVLLLTSGLSKIKYAATAVNSNSSRSHCIFFIDVITYTSPDVFIHTTYKFCDLAGSERLKRTENVGSRLKEAQRINNSLMVLGRCLNAIHQTQTKKNSDIVIPFRDSKLTFLLQGPLLGKEKMTMIVTMTPSNEFYEENTQVLAFSSIAKSITCKRHQKNARRTRYSWFATHTNYSSEQSLEAPNRFTDYYSEFNEVKEQNVLLNERIQELEKELIRKEYDIRNELVSGFAERSSKQQQMWNERFQHYKNFCEEKIKHLEQRIRELEKPSPADASSDDSEDTLEISD